MGCFRSIICRFLESKFLTVFIAQAQFLILGGCDQDHDSSTSLPDTLRVALFQRKFLAAIFLIETDSKNLYIHILLYIDTHT